ncbi:MAG: ethanolamine ammonia-lyase subunit EutC [Clostridiales Family XIII bacterium]|jgi:ethanolamine ammonia-lyase small subunit|nr:ethanolamine ammonia-lyase subunit EutC [Clostridiales Family XIII bacterium]
MISDMAGLEKTIAEVIKEYLSGGAAAWAGKNGRPAADAPDRGGAVLRDITGQAAREAEFVSGALDREAILAMKRRTSARIGIGRAGPRLLTQTMLTLRADHAAARDAVLKDVDPDMLRSLGFIELESRCADRQEFLTRPDLGRALSDGAVDALLEKCVPNPDIQVFVADGLSSSAVTANLPDLWPCLMDGLHEAGVKTGTPFFVRFGRVALMDQVSELLGAKAVCALIGERPGLSAAESLSAYVAYGAKTGMDESGRTVVSNIHGNGIPAVEAGAYLAELLQAVLRAKASGIAFRKDDGL